ncbi:hypothetical protein [Dyella choica]|uniref:Uncharacterized protein n=1 Tax=Dyella choica TaxID=1927959 RepID=A0A3S0PNS5_9GAMM|nr:hypothetical protein [Dyella choica]RUL75982.1 hypothetical protein EKH80_09680 [Dyella choica]
MTGAASRYVRWWFPVLLLTSLTAAAVAWVDGWIITASEPLNDAANASRSGGTTDAPHSSFLAPRHFLQAFGGELEGSDGGEFGGHLTFLHPDGSTDLLLDRDVRAIVQFPSGVAVLTGLDHLGMSSGAIYKIDQKSNGSLHASLLHPLRGAPDNFRWTTRGDLLFDVMVRPRLRHTFIERSSSQCFVLTKEIRLRRQWCALVFNNQP